MLLTAMAWMTVLCHLFLFLIAVDLELTTGHVVVPPREVVPHRLMLQ